jgi:hypothetical protein
MNVGGLAMIFFIGVVIATLMVGKLFHGQKVNRRCDYF